MKQKHFKPGKPNYERTKTWLENITHDVIITWEPPRLSICPSSVAKYFHDLGYKTKLCGVQKSTHTVYSVDVPVINDENQDEFVEWLGMIALHANLRDGTPDGYVTTYQTPEPHQPFGLVRFFQWRGFFTTNQITRFYNRLR